MARDAHIHAFAGIGSCAELIAGASGGGRSGGCQRAEAVGAAVAVHHAAEQFDATGRCLARSWARRRGGVPWPTWGRGAGISRRLVRRVPGHETSSAGRRTGVRR